MAYFLLFLRRMPDTNNAMSAARDAASTIESKTIEGVKILVSMESKSL